MGYKLDFKIERYYIDHGHDGKPFYDEEIHVTGSSVTDSVIFKQEDDVIAMNIGQFFDLIQGLRKSSLWTEIMNKEFMNENTKD